MPPFKCRVLNCQNTSNDIKPRKISFVPFPEDPEIVNEWLERCGQPKAFNIKSARLCSIHFAEKDFEDGDSGARRMSTRKKVLKKECVPTLFIPDVMEINIARRNSLPKRRGRRKIIKEERIEEPKTKTANEIGQSNAAGISDSLENAKFEGSGFSSDSEFEAGSCLSTTPRDEVISNVSTFPSKFTVPCLRLLQTDRSNCSSKSQVKGSRAVGKEGSKSKALKRRSSATDELIHVMKIQAQVNEKQAHVNETLALVSFSQAISTLPAPTATILIKALGSPNFLENLRSSGYLSNGNFK